MSRSRPLALPLLAALPAVLLAAPLLARAEAQAASRPLVSSLRTGDTVRAWARSPAEQIGTVVTLTADTLGLLRPDGRRVAMPTLDLSHVDVQRGTATSPARVVLGLLLGGALGTGAGGIIGMGIECASGCNEEFGGLGGLVVGGFVGGLTGIIAGGVLGARFKVPRWEQVYP